MIKLEKFDYSHLVHHFTVPLNKMFLSIANHSRSEVNTESCNVPQFVYQDFI